MTAVLWVLVPGKTRRYNVENNNFGRLWRIIVVAVFAELLCMYIIEITNANYLRVFSG